MPRPTTIATPRLLTGGADRADMVVEIADGRIREVRQRVRGERCDAVLPDGAFVPGMVDLQVNGAFGVDFAAAGRQDWAMVSARLPETGVTAYVPTFITAPVAELADVLRRVAQVHAAPPAGARVLGAHFEGPFLAETRRGAHNATYLCDPAPGDIEQVLAAAPPGTLAVVTLAPERLGALEAVERLVGAGVLVSVGHTDATGEQVAAAAEAGARAVTHLFNAQRPMHHREPGVPGHSLVDDRLSLGLIVDLHHVTADVVRLAFRAAGDRVVLVTDAVAAAGMPPGRYLLGGAPVARNTVDLGVPLPVAVDAATRRPADLLDRSDLGRVEVGAQADLAWLGPDLLTRATWVAGSQVFGEGVQP